MSEFRELTAGKEIDYDGRKARLTWATGGVPPVWIAGYGPKVLNWPDASATASFCSSPIPT